MKKVLVVDDEEKLIEVVEAYLKKEGYIVFCAKDGEEALEQFHQRNPDMILLDLMLPKMNGFSVCEAIRKESQVPIIMLTALDDDASQMKGFDALADDYITKPFSMPLVVKHIEAVLRRAEQGTGVETNILRYKDLTLDTDSFTILVKDESVSLTIREFEILKLLVENQGRVFTRESLLDSIWGYDYFGDEKIVNTHIKNIRKKLGVDYIETIRGAGYKIEKENQREHPGKDLPQYAGPAGGLLHYHLRHGDDLPAEELPHAAGRPGHGGLLRPGGDLRAERLGGKFGQSDGIFHDEQRLGGSQR